MNLTLTLRQFAIALGVLVFLQGCYSNYSETIRYDTNDIGSYGYQIELNYSNGMENEVFTLFLDNPLARKGERNCFWINSTNTNTNTNTTEICGMHITGWKPLGRKLWISLDTGIDDANRILIGRVSNNSAIGEIVFSNWNERKIGTFQLRENLK